MRISRVALTLIALVCSPVACGRRGEDVSPPKRSCSLVVWHRPTRDDARVEIATSWEGFVPQATVRAANGYRVARIEPPPGEQSYAFVEDGLFRIDEHVGTSSFVQRASPAGVSEWTEVTMIEVGRCELPELRIERTTGNATGASRLVASFTAGAAGDALDATSVRMILRDGRPANGKQLVDPATGSLELETSLPVGKHTITVTARDVRGREAPPVRATIWVEPQPFDWRDALLYQVVVDRFRTKEGASPAPPTMPSARAGGHLDGVRKAIEAGELDALGVRAIWLSPLYDNAEGTWAGADSRPYSSYHGYWPVAARTLEPAVADETSLDALIAAAHTRGIRVIFDVVPNHVHQDHPYLAAHDSEGWFNGSVAKGTGCVCGSASCGFATSALSCWFTPYLPDVDWRNGAAARQMTDDVAWWMDRFDGDGVRIDAVPLMPRAAVRRIAANLRKRFDHDGHRSFLLGETFTGAEGHAELRWYLGPFGLDSEFDFPLMWALRETVAEQKKTLRTLEATIRAGELGGEETAFLVVSRKGEVEMPASTVGLPAGSWVDVLSSASIDVGNAAQRVDGGPRSVRLFLPKGSRCL